MRKYTFDYNYFKVINSKNKAYWLGWIVSDGSVNKYNLRLRLQELDIEILQKFKRDVLFTGPITIESNYNKKHQNLCNITLSSVKLIKDLFQLGVISNKVHNTIFPEIPNDFISDYLRGFFDGDGCIYVNNTFKYKPAQCSIIATENWCIGCENYLQKFNIKSKIYKDKRHDPRIASIVINCPEDIERFYNLIYFELDNELYLERKFKAFTDYILFRKIFNYDLP